MSTPIFDMPSIWASGSIICLNHCSRRDPGARGISGWAPKLTDLLSHSDDQFLPWPLYVLRMSDPWTTREGLTMIGDAAHIMPPFLGAGANMAMLDAVELSDTLTSTRSTDLTTALATFERHMLDRMTPLIEQSIAIQNVMFADDAPDGLVALIKAGKKGS